MQRKDHQSRANDLVQLLNAKLPEQSELRSHTHHWNLALSIAGGTAIAGVCTSTIVCCAGTVSGGGAIATVWISRGGAVTR